MSATRATMLLCSEWYPRIAQVFDARSCGYIDDGRGRTAEVFDGTDYCWLRMPWLTTLPKDIPTAELRDGRVIWLAEPLAYDASGYFHDLHSRAIDVWNRYRRTNERVVQGLVA